jgi:O-antigen/teichoic acid export membrane protein
MTTSSVTAEPVSRALARHTLYNVLGQAIPVVVGLATIPVTVRLLGAERFGLLGLAWAVLGYVGMLDFGLGRATTKFVAEYLAVGDRVRLERVATLAVASQTVMGLVGGGALALLAPTLAGLFGVRAALHAETQHVFLILALSVPFVVLAASLRAILEAAQRFDLVNLIRTPTSAAMLAVPAAAAALGADLPAIVLLLLGVRILACAASVGAIPRAIPGFRWRFEPQWELLRPLLGFGGWVSVSNIVSPVLVYLERFLLAALAGVAAVAYYTAPYEVVTRLLILPAGLAGALFPALSAGGTEGAPPERLLGRPLRFLLLALAPPVVFLVACGGPVVGAWLGAAYAERSTTALAILAAGVLVNGLAFIPYAYLLGRGRPDLPAKFHLVELPLYVAAGWLLIGAFGVNGAALTWTLRVTVDAGLLVAAVWRVAGVPPPRLLGQRGGRAVTAVLVLTAAAAAVRALVPGVVLRVELLGATLLLFAVCAWRYVLSDAERAEVGRVLG